MSAETLRRAASLMRERAEAASREPAYLDDHWVYEGGEDGDGIFWAVTRNKGDTVAASLFPKVSAHIASWHPAVALAVADWLEIMATPHAEGYRGPAVAVARAYLGEPS